jgi:hypothetical protein
MAESEDLVSEVARRLELDWQYVAHVPAWDVERVAKIRSAGRQAGRTLGYRVMTMQTDPEDRDHGLVVVVVAVKVPPSAEDDERMTERAQLLMESLWRDMEPGGAEEG